MAQPRSRATRTGLAFAVLCCLALAFPSGASQVTGGLPLAVETTAVSFSPFDASRARFGRLEWRGGVEVISDDERFGGLSGLVITDRGAGMVAVSDLGWWFTARIDYAGDLLSSVSGAYMGRLLDAAGRPFRGKANQDAESIAAAADGSGDMLVAFERKPRVLRYPFGRFGMAARPQSLSIPQEVADGPENSELEAIGQFPERGPMRGAVVIISERQLTSQGDIRGWFVGGPRPGRFSIRRQGDYDITDLAIDPRTLSVFTLERRFTLLTGVGMMIRRFDVADLSDDRPAEGEILIEADQRLTIDNMEGLGIHRTADGELRLTVLSDDNYNGFQRTLLMQFALPSPAAPGEAEGR